MFGVALTGGIGSGKSSVTERLSARGAEIIDADELIHEIQGPGGPALEPIFERFGGSVRMPDGSLDRPALAKIVFSDPEARADLNAIVTPLVGEKMAARVGELMSSERVVVFSIPLLVEQHRRLGFGAVVVVDCPVDLAVERLVALRGMDRDDVVARVATQATREERLGFADYVVDNSSDLDHLDAEVERLWGWIAQWRAAQGNVSGQQD